VSVSGEWLMNGLTILSGTYGLLAAIMVIGKIRFHHLLKLEGSIRTDLASKPTINKEATDDYMDLMTVILVAVAFLLQMSSEFTDYKQWSMTTWIVYFFASLLAGAALLAFSFGTQILTWEYALDDSYTMAYPASGAPLVFVFVSMLVLFVYAFVSKTFELLLWSFLPLSLAWASLLITAFAQKLFGRPRFQRARQ
jgi:hypothetical protein